MSHDKIGPHELRLRELREERERKAKGPRKLIPYAGKDRTVSGRKFHHPWDQEGAETMIVGIKTAMAGHLLNIKKWKSRAAVISALSGHGPQPDQR